MFYFNQKCERDVSRRILFCIVSKILSSVFENHPGIIIPDSFATYYLKIILAYFTGPYQLISQIMGSLLVP